MVGPTIGSAHAAPEHLLDPPPYKENITSPGTNIIPDLDNGEEKTNNKAKRSEKHLHNGQNISLTYSTSHKTCTTNSLLLRPHI